MIKTIRFLIVFLFISFIPLDSTFSEESLLTLVKQLKPVVVTILTYGENNEPLGQGTGVFINEEGNIITNYHVIEGAYSARIKLFNGEIFDIKSVISSNKRMDLVKLKVEIPEQTFHYIEISDDTPLVAESIFVIGSPKGLEQTVSEGIVSAIRNIDDLGTFYQISASISPGSSGSPVINMKGNLIGIATFQIVDGQNLNFASPVINFNATGKGEANISLIEFTRKRAIRAENGMTQEDIQLEAKSWFKRGCYFEESQEPEKALWAYSKAIEIAPDYISALNNRGVIFKDLGELELSLSDFEKIINLSPNDFLGYFGRGNTLSKMGKFEEGIHDFNTCLKMNPDDANAFHNRGYNWMLLENYDQAISDFNKALKIEPNYISVYIHRGIIWSKIGDYDRSIEDNSKAIQIDPKSINGYKNRGQEFFRKAISVYNKRNIQLAIELIEKAISDFRKALEINPNHTDAYKDLQTAQSALDTLKR